MRDDTSETNKIEYKWRVNEQRAEKIESQLKNDEHNHDSSQSYSNRK